MKNLFFSAVLAVFFANFAFAQLGVGFKGGINFNQANARILGQKVETASTTGFHVGALLDVPLNDYISIRPELLFVQKGGEGRFLGNSILLTDRLSYLELPLSIVGKVDAGPGKVFLGAGGYAAALLGGKRTTTTNIFIGTATRTENIEVGNNDGDSHRPLDYGLNFTAGYEFGFGLMVSGNYSLGLANILPEGDDNNFIRNGYIGISAAYILRFD